MIAACPKCKARYRIEREKLRPEGVRLRCTRCEAVFRVRPPEAVVAPARPEETRPPVQATASGSSDDRPTAVVAQLSPRANAAEPSSPDVQRPVPGPEVADDAPCVGVALPDAELGKRVAEALAARGFRSFQAHDGVEAMLEIQRQLPVAVVLSAVLPKMYGFQVCEIVKRNESLSRIHVILAGAVHHKNRYRRPPDDLYGADAYVEEPDLPEALFPILDRQGTEPVSPSPSTPAPAAAPRPEMVDPVPPPAPSTVPADAPAVDGLEEERAKAERLARIIVSDIVLYNEDRFTEAVRMGNAVEALAAEIAEGRALFVERVDERVRSERDHLADELLRVARSRGMA